MSDNYKICSKIFVKGNIKALTGFHIGGNSVGMAIGGADSVVARNPLDNAPYIPGSSLRGKMRSLLERARGPEGENAEEGGFSRNNRGDALAGKDPNTLLGQLFGVAAESEAKGPTRLIVRDASLTEDSLKELEQAPNTDMPMTEVKTEVWIDRITCAAMPRQIERVPAGSEFGFEFIVTILDVDDKLKFLNLVYEGMRLVEADTLGGSGSRGYGQVKFTVREVLERTVEDYKSGDIANALEGHEIPIEFRPLNDQE